MRARVIYKSISLITTRNARTQPHKYVIDGVDRMGTVILAEQKMRTSVARLRELYARPRQQYNVDVVCECVCG